MGIDVGHNCIGVGGSTKFVRATRMSTSIQSINMQDNKLDFLAANKMAKALSLSERKSIIDEFPKHFDFMQVGQLRSLNFRHNALGNAGAAMLFRALRGNPTLRYLSLAWNGLAGEASYGLADLFSFTTCCAIEELDIRDNLLGLGAVIGIALLRLAKHSEIELPLTDQLSDKVASATTPKGGAQVRALSPVTAAGATVVPLSGVASPTSPGIRKALSEGAPALFPGFRMTDTGLHGLPPIPASPPMSNQPGLNSMVADDSPGRTGSPPGSPPGSPTGRKMAASSPTGAERLSVTFQDSLGSGGSSRRERSRPKELILDSHGTQLSQKYRHSSTLHLRRGPEGLKILNLANNCLDGQGAALLASVIHLFISLESLLLYNNIDISHSSDALPLQRVEAAETLDSPRKSAPSIASVAASVHTPTSGILHKPAAKNNADRASDGLIALAGSLPPSLVRLSLGSCGLGADIACKVCKVLIRHSTLRELDLSDNDINSDSNFTETVIKLLKSNGHLKDLCLGLNNIEDEAATSIARFPANSDHPVVINLSANKLSFDLREIISGRFSLQETLSRDALEWDALKVWGALKDKARSGTLSGTVMSLTECHADMPLLILARELEAAPFRINDRLQV